MKAKVLFFYILNKNYNRECMKLSYISFLWFTEALQKIKMFVNAWKYVRKTASKQKNTKILQKNDRNITFYVDKKCKKCYNIIVFERTNLINILLSL